jgi:hypothetical protein
MSSEKIKNQDSKIDSLNNFNKYKPLLIKTILGFPLTIISLYFVSGYILGHWGEVQSNLESLDIAGFLIGTFFLCVFFLFRSITWNSLLEKEGFTPPMIHSIYLLSISEIKRYIPGSVLGFISRLNNFSTFKIPATKVVKLIFYESIIFLITSIVISVPGVFFLWENAKLPFNINPGFIVTALIVLFIIASIVYLLPVKHAQRVADVFLHLHKYRQSFLYMLAGWVFYGIGSFFIATSLANIWPLNFVELSSLFVLSWLVGYLVLIAPLGLGVREAFVTYGLAILMPAPIAAVIAILSRLALVLAEVIFLAASFIFYKFIKDDRDFKL